MPKTSAGILLYRQRADDGRIEVLLAHMGGPLWARKDARAWSIPKGEYVDPEEPLTAALREFAEELGSAPPDADHVSLGEIRQSGGKRVLAWAMAGDLDTTTVQSNTFEMEWPRGSGRMQQFPEIDRAEWFDLDTARDRIVAAQAEFLNRLRDAVATG